jgi:REP element-mobilizing transposase RayT
MARGLDRQLIFRDDQDREDFVRRLASLAEAGAVSVYAWVLLPNHFHLLLRTRKRALPRTMRSLLTGYAGTFNRRHRRSGHLFQNRYKSIVVDEEPYFLELVRYLHLNPLRAGLVSGLAGLARYAYSGHPALLGKISYPWQETGEVLRQFARTLRQGRTQYVAFMAEGVRAGRRPELMGGGLVRSMGGWAAVQKLRRGREGYASDERILGGSEFVEGFLEELQREEVRRTRAARRAPDLPSLVAKVAHNSGITIEALVGGGRRRDICWARDGLAFLWVEVLGRSGRHLARELGIRPESVYKGARRGRKEQDRWHDVLGF